MFYEPKKITRATLSCLVGVAQAYPNLWYVVYSRTANLKLEIQVVSGLTVSEIPGTLVHFCFVPDY
jgi:hypothetical protein